MAGTKTNEQQTAEADDAAVTAHNLGEPQVATNYTTTPLRCPDCHATLDIPVQVAGLERNDDGDRILQFKVQEDAFQPYITHHVSLSDHSLLAELIGSDDD